MSLSIKSARLANRGPANMQGGILGDLWGAAKGAVGGAVGAVFRGGNPLAGAVGGAVRGFKGGPAPIRALPIPGIAGSGSVVPGPTFGFAGPNGQNGGGGAYAVSPAGTVIACPRGTHANASDYFLKDGSFIAKGSRCVQNRRRNPMNPRALGRAISRVESGKRWQSKLGEITTKRFTAAGNRKACD